MRRLTKAEKLFGIGIIVSGRNVEAAQRFRKRFAR